MFVIAISGCFVLFYYYLFLECNIRGLFFSFSLVTSSRIQHSRLYAELYCTSQYCAALISAALCLV